MTGNPHIGGLPEGLRILIVEDMGLIAHELQWRLERLHCRVVGIAGTFEDAMHRARTEDMNGAMLDLNLDGRVSTPVAAILEERSIPFIVTTGYDRSYFPAALAKAAHLQKPFTQEALKAVMLPTFLPGRSAV